MIYVPEVTLKKALDLFVKYLNDDLVANVSTPESSYLYQLVTLLFGTNTGVGIDNYDFFTQGKTVFNRAADDPKLLKVVYGYNMSINKPPIICVKLGSQLHGSNNAMGNGGGYLGDFYVDTSTDDQDDPPNTITNMAFSKSRRMSCNLNVIIMSDNINEVLLIYYILQSGLVALLDHLNLSGFENIKMNGQDLVIQDDLIPKNFYNRVIQLNFEYTMGALEYPMHQMIKDIQTNLQSVIVID